MSYDDPDKLLKDISKRMDKAVAVASDQLAKLRTGRASTDLVADLKVDYYGTQTPLHQMAGLSTPDPRTIAIQPYDPSAVGAIEKAIMQSDLGLTPNTGGEGSTRIIRINIPELSEERREELVRVARKEAEDGRISVRNIRREANDALKKLEKEGELSEDDARRYHDEVQSETDGHVNRIDALLEQKEQALMQI